MRCPVCSRYTGWMRTRCPACRAKLIQWYIIAGILIAMIVIPWVAGMLNRPKAAAPAA